MALALPVGSTPLPLSFRATKLLALTAIFLALNSCTTTKATRAASAALSGCTAQETALQSAAAWFEAPERKNLTPTHYQAVLAQAGAGQTSGTALTQSQSSQVNTDLEAEGTALDQLATTYSEAQNCRLEQAIAASKNTAPAGSWLSTYRQSLDRLRATARDAAQRGDSLAGIYRTEAEHLADNHPGVTAALTRANAPVGQNIGYKVLSPARIYTKPDTHSGGIAMLRKGQRVSGPPGNPKPGWVTLGLNDGSIGYTLSDGLRPLAPNNSSLRARSQREASDDPIVAALLLARRTLPGKLEALQEQLSAASEREARLLSDPNKATS